MGEEEAAGEGEESSLLQDRASLTSCLTSAMVWEVLTRTKKVAFFLLQRTHLGGGGREGVERWRGGQRRKGVRI